jgi:hypothetical protein
MHRIVIKIKIKKGALALFFDALFSSFANLSLKKRKHAAGAALVLAPGITLDAEKDRFTTLSWVVEWVFFSPQLVLQGDDNGQRSRGERPNQGPQGPLPPL